MPVDSRPGAEKIKHIVQSFKTKVQRKDRKFQHYKFIKPKLFEIIMDSDSLIILTPISEGRKSPPPPLQELPILLSTEVRMGTF